MKAGAFTIRFIESKHGPALFGRVPYPGTIDAPLAQPAKASAYRLGGVFSIVISHPSGTLVHHGSAGFIPNMYDGITADTLLLGIAGRGDTEEYLAETALKLKVRDLVPIHFDNFFKPLRGDMPILPNQRIGEFFKKAEAHGSAFRVKTLPLGEPCHGLLTIRPVSVPGSGYLRTRVAFIRASSWTGVGMEGFEHLSQALLGGVGVDLCRREVLVPQHLLDRADIGAPVEQLRGKAVAQGMGGHAVHKPGGPGPLHHDIIHRASRYPAAPGCSRRADRSADPNFFFRSQEIRADHPHGAVSEEHDPLVGALAHDLEPAALEIDVLDIRGTELRHARPGGIEGLEDRPVPVIDECFNGKIDDRFYLVEMKELGEARFLFRVADLYAGFFPMYSLL